MKNETNTIDLLGLKCPLPILRANRIIKNYKKLLDALLILLDLKTFFLLAI